MKKVIFNSCFKEDMQSFIEYRMANFAWNTHRLDNYRLASFDRYLTGISYNKEIVPQIVINQWLENADVPDASINGYLKTIRNFMRYRADMCILRSLADSDAFQSGRCAAHNGRPETLAIIN